MKPHALIAVTPGFYRDVERPVVHVIVPELAERMVLERGTRFETAYALAVRMLEALDETRGPGHERFVLVAHFNREPWLSRVRKG